MKEKGVSQYALIKKHNVSPGQITRLKRDESVSTHTIEMFCKILDCKVEDVMEYIPDIDLENKNDDESQHKQNEYKEMLVGDEE